MQNFNNKNNHDNNIKIININNNSNTVSGAGTKLKVGEASGAGKKCLALPLHFLALKVQLVVLVSAFVVVSTVWSVQFGQYSLVSFLLAVLLLTVSRPWPAICESARENVPPCPTESAPLHVAWLHVFSDDNCDVYVYAVACRPYKQRLRLVQDLQFQRKSHSSRVDSIKIVIKICTAAVALKGQIF